MQPLKLIAFGNRTESQVNTGFSAAGTKLVSKQAFLACEMQFPASNAAVLLAGPESLSENKVDIVAEDHSAFC